MNILKYFSMICNGCDENFLNFHYHKSNNKGQVIYCHGLLRCQSVKQCEIIHNRDKNAVQNMLMIVNSGKRPNIFTRGNSCSR